MDTPEKPTDGEFKVYLTPQRRKAPSHPIASAIAGALSLIGSIFGLIFFSAGISSARTPCNTDSACAGHIPSSGPWLALFGALLLFLGLSALYCSVKSKLGSATVFITLSALMFLVALVAAVADTMTHFVF